MRPHGALLELPPRLLDFLPAKRRGGELRLPVDGTSTIGHLLASLGVPKTEVGPVLVDGHAVALGYRPSDGDRLSVRALPWPQPAPTDPPRFVLDVHLGTLARRLRLLGVDTAYAAHADDEQLVVASTTEQRVLLTRDRGLLHRRALRWGAHVYHQRPDDQLREVLDRFDPPLAPWTRCPRCNGPVSDVTKEQVGTLLEAGTRSSYETFRRCTGCGQVYWRGAHGKRLQQLVDAAIQHGRAVDRP